MFTVHLVPGDVHHTCMSVAEAAERQTSCSYFYSSYVADTEYAALELASLGQRC